MDFATVFNYSVLVPDSGYAAAASFSGHHTEAPAEKSDTAIATISLGLAILCLRLAIHPVQTWTISSTNLKPKFSKLTSAFLATASLVLAED